MDISDLELSVRTINVLKNNGITTMTQFMDLDHRQVMGWKGSGRRTWNEIRDMQRHVRDTTRRASLPGRAAALIFQLNEMKGELARSGFFIGRTESGLLRLYRNVTKEDFDEIG